MRTKAQKNLSWSSASFLPFAFCLLPFALGLAAAQEGRSFSRTAKVHITGYIFDLELVPQTHQLKAKTLVRFVPDEDAISAVFELNNNLKPQRVTDGSGKTV